MRRKVLSFDGKKFAAETVELIRESPLTIFLNGKEFITLLCNPSDIDELAAGFLKSEGLIDGKADIRQIRISRDRKSVQVRADVRSIDEKLHEKRIVTTGCGKGSIFYFAIDTIKCRPQRVRKKWSGTVLLEKMKEISFTRGSRKAGGMHACGFYNGRELIVREDIGRHNALDKIVGHCVLNEFELSDGVIFTTGRLSSEMLLKAAKINASVVVSRSAATDLSVELAEKLNITVIGYARGGRMTVYTGGKRITSK